MNTLADHVQETVMRELQAYPFEVAHFLQIPCSSEKRDLQQFLRESIEDAWIGNSAEVYQFLIQIRPKKKNPQEIWLEEPHSLYFPNGKFNFSFLKKNADTLLQAKEFHLAEKMYFFILSQYDKSPDILFRMGQCEEGRGNIEKAASFYEKAIAYSSQWSPQLSFYRRLFLMFVAQNAFSKAIPVIERALLIPQLTDEATQDLHQWAGDCWLKENNTLKAQEHYSKALQQCPESGILSCRLGDVFLKMKEYVQAKPYFQRALTHFPQETQALFGLGLCFFYTGDKKTAHDYWAKTLEIEPFHAEALFYLVQSAYDLKMYVLAEKKLKRYVEQSPFNPHLSYSLAGLQFHMGQFSEALSWVKKILEHDPEYAPAQKLFEKISFLNKNSIGR